MAQINRKLNSESTSETAENQFMQLKTARNLATNYNKISTYDFGESSG